MKTSPVIAATVLSFFLMCGAGSATGPENPGERLAHADAILNERYQTVLKLYADDPLFIEKFRDSQRAWLKFRDAELAALFPHAEKNHAYYGSILDDAWAHWQTELTEARSAQLERWIRGVEEGDVYGGSIRGRSE